MVTPMHLSLHRTMLRYGGGLILHTASSGPVAGLDTLYLCLRDADGIEAAGEVRINIAYLNGLAANDIVTEALDILPRLDLTTPTVTLLNEPPPLLSEASAPLRMLVDIALHDLAARRLGQPLAALLAIGQDGPTTVAHPTNQTLFVSDDATFQCQAQTYVDRGFTDLKVRIGAADFAEDLRRIHELRMRFGSQIEIAADANGAWTLADAPSRLDVLAPLGLTYVEQPVAPMALDLLAALADRSPVPIMLDESIADEDTVMALAAGGHRLMAHLKLVKLGGIAATLRAARALTAGGVPFMIGQMNEGGLATAAALHLSVAVKPRFAELYGADGITDDPASGLVYAGGTVRAPAGPGLGLSLARERTTTLWEN